MKIIVLGAGVVGVTTAYRLAERGHAVTVIDRCHEVAAEASHANGGQLSYDFASPMASPSVLRHLADYILGRDEAFNISLSLNPGFLFWGARFLLNCAPSVAQQNADKLSALAFKSQIALDTLCTETNVAFEHRKAGKLVIFKSNKEFNAARQKVEEKNGNEQNLSVANADECSQIEPALENWNGNAIAGGIYAANDEVGDARQFAFNLAEIATREHGVEFLMGRAASAISTQGNAVAGVIFDNEILQADAVIVCMGVNAPKLLRSLGISAPIWPVYGYSITAPASSTAPKTAITDLGAKMVYSTIGENLRVAGFADVGGVGAQRPEVRLSQLQEKAERHMPAAAGYKDNLSHWVGMRPSTPNSLPIVGACKVENLYLNIGHGMFGWTLSAVCADQIAEIINKCDRERRAQHAMAA